MTTSSSKDGARGPSVSIAPMTIRLKGRNPRRGGSSFVAGAPSLDLFRMGRCIPAPFEPIALTRSLHDEQEAGRWQA